MAAAAAAAAPAAAHLGREVLLEHALPKHVEGKDVAAGGGRMGRGRSSVVVQRAMHPPTALPPHVLPRGPCQPSVHIKHALLDHIVHAPRLPRHLYAMHFRARNSCCSASLSQEKLDNEVSVSKASSILASQSCEKGAETGTAAVDVT